MVPNTTVTNRFLWWILPPLAVALFAFGLRFLITSNSGSPLPADSVQGELPKNIAADSPRREYVLEVIGLGVTLDKYRQGALWEALQRGGSHATIREQDKSKYPWSELEKDGIAGGRGGDTLENGAQWTPMYWPVPVFNAEPPILDPTFADRPNNPLPGLAGGADLSGMAWHLFVVGPRRFAERPDRILDDAFEFFDKNPDVPYIVVNADDSMSFRHVNRAPGTPPLIKDGRYIPEMPDSSALIVLARRERIDPVRQFSYEDVSPEASVDDLNHYGIARRLFLEYDKLSFTFARTEGEKEPTAVAKRQPVVSEWLPVAAQFAQRADLRRHGMLDTFRPSTHFISADWKPTAWFPIPWNRDQLAEFDKLPTLGFIHCPVYVKFTDAEGKPIQRADARAKALQAGFDEALLTLPTAARAKGPALIVAATGGHTEQLITLHSVLRHHASAGGTEIDSGKPGQFIHTDKRLGNTGAATLFMQMAIGVMGSYRTGSISAAINLRDKTEATIVLISPPSEEKRARQTHPTGAADVFAHKGTPAIDPSHYGTQP